MTYRIDGDWVIDERNNRARISRWGSEENAETSLGANHGAGMEAEIEVTVDRGAVPRLKPRTTLAVRLERVAAFKAAMERAKAERNRLGAIAGKWREAYRIKEAIAKARYSKCHKTRMAMLAEFVPPPAPVVMRPMVAVEPPATNQGGLFA